MGVLLSHGTKHVGVGFEEATRGLHPCDTQVFSPTTKYVHLTEL